MSWDQGIKPTFSSPSLSLLAPANGNGDTNVNNENKHKFINDHINTNEHNCHGQSTSLLLSAQHINTTSTPTSTMTPSATLSFSEIHQHDSSHLMDGLDATMAAFHDLGLDLAQSYEVQLKQEQLTSPMFSTASPSSCRSSSAGDLVGGRFMTLQQQQQEQEEKKVFDTLELFSEHDLDFDLVNGSSAVDGASGPCSSSSPNGFELEGSSIFGSVVLPETAQDFVLYPRLLSAGPNVDSNADLRLGVPTSMAMIDTPASSPSSSPSSSTPSSPSSPSYDDIMLPVVACASCKRSHIKCDHGRPCLNCLKHPVKAMSCHDAVPKPRGRPKGGSKAAAGGDVTIGGRIHHHPHHPHHHQAGFQLLPGNPYQYLRGQPENSQQPQFYRQRALSFPHLPSSHEPSTYILQSQPQHQPQQQPQHQQQRPNALQHQQQHSFHYHYPQHHHQQLLQQQQQQQQQVQQFHQRAATHPQTHYSTPDTHGPLSGPMSSPQGVELHHRPNPGSNPSSPYSWSTHGPCVPELKSMPMSRRPTLSPSSSVFEIQSVATHVRSHPIPMQVPQAAGQRYVGGHQQTTTTASASGAMFASLPSQLHSPLATSPPALDAFQLQQLNEHKQKLYQHQQQHQQHMMDQQRRGSYSQVQGHPAMKHQSYFP